VLFFEDTECGYLDEWDKGPADATGIYQETWEAWMLDFWTSDAVFKPDLTGTAFSLTTAPQNGRHFYILFLSHTDKALPIFSKNASRHVRYCCTSWRSDLNVLPVLVIIFPDVRVHWYVYNIMTSDHSSVHSPVQLIYHTYFCFWFCTSAQVQYQ